VVAYTVEVEALGVPSQLACVVEPVDPLERRELDLLRVLPRALVVDRLGLEQADNALGQGVDAPMAVDLPQLRPVGVPAASHCSVLGRR